MEGQSQIEQTDALDVDVADDDEAGLGDAAKKGEGFIGKEIEF